MSVGAVVFSHFFGSIVLFIVISVVLCSFVIYDSYFLPF